MRPGLNRSWATLSILLGALATPAHAMVQQAIPAELRVPMAPSSVRAEGQSHLIYELHVTNLGRAPLALERLEAVDAEGTPLQVVEGENLRAILARPGLAADEASDPRLIAPGLRAVVFMDVVAPRDAPLPALLRHRLTFRPVETPSAGVQVALEGGGTAVSPASAPLGPPLRGGGWVAMHGLSNASSHRRTMLTLDGAPVIAQRFAIDWTRIGADGQAFRGDPADNRNWTPYGAEVLAVADGTVVSVQDGIPENDPTAASRAVPIDLTTVGGNWLILALPDGRCVFSAHLQPGSLRARPGDVVRKGQTIALLGNSGQSDAPHLHVHVVDRPSPLSAEGLPLVFDSFAVEGHLSSLGRLVDGTGWRPDGPARPVHGEMPVENAVIAFP